MTQSLHETNSFNQHISVKKPKMQDDANLLFAYWSAVEFRAAEVKSSQWPRSDLHPAHAHTVICLFIEPRRVLQLGARNSN